jgi:hypothetical protein
MLPTRLAASDEAIETIRVRQVESLGHPAQPGEVFQTNVVIRCAAFAEAVCSDCENLRELGRLLSGPPGEKLITKIPQNSGCALHIRTVPVRQHPQPGVPPIAGLVRYCCERNSELPV